jgi:hypothetical protein
MLVFLESTDGVVGIDVDDILRRLARAESDVSDLRGEVAGVSAVIPHLATKVDLADKVGDVKAKIMSSEILSGRRAP